MEMLLEWHTLLHIQFLRNQIIQIKTQELRSYITRMH